MAQIREPPQKKARRESLEGILEDEFVHGTSFQNLDSILRHGLVAKTHDIAFCEHFPVDGHVPGLKSPPEVLIVLDKSKMLRKGVRLSQLPEGSGYVTKGQVLEGGKWVTNTTDAPGAIRPWFFSKIVDNRPATVGNVLFLARDTWNDPKWKKCDAHELPDRLVHATVGGNLAGIWHRGLIPHGGANPQAEGRDGHAKLFIGGEGHVNAILPMSPVVEVAGLHGAPDALVSFDVRKAVAAGLEVAQSPHRPDHFFLRGQVPPECLVGAHANSPVDLPKHLDCKVVPPGEAFEKLPIIDLSLPRDVLIEKVRWACSVPGFMQVINHKVDASLERRLLELQKQFFALPHAQKIACSMTDDSPVRGYFGRGAENLDAVLEGESKERVGALGTEVARLVDNKEGLDMNGAPWSRPGHDYVSQIFGKPSKLPSELCPGLREVAREMSEQLMALGKELLEIMALALGRDKDFFNRCMTQEVATHRLLHYWPLQGDYQCKTGCGAHTDYGLLTILKQDDVGGLQVLSAQDMQWVLVPPRSDAYIVNLGDMLSQWTGNHFKSTVHRVVNTSNRERYSSPYFIEPNLDTVIKRGELCPEKPEEETAGDILRRFYASAGILKQHHGSVADAKV